MSDDNIQQQEDEVLVLQSIFDEDFSPQNPGFELKLSIILPHPVNVKLPEPQTTPKLLPISHLPPIHLYFTYHEDYPSKFSPSYTLSSVWLSRRQLSILCGKLDEIWEQSPGEVVVYNWAEYIREKSLEFLEIIENKSITLPRNELSISTNFDPRAHSFYQPKIALQVLRHIFEHNRELTIKEFELAEQTCRVCYTESPGKDFIHLACGDSYCSDCLHQFVETFVVEGSFDNLVCPNMNCRCPLLPTDIRKCTTDKLYERFENMTLKRGLENMGDSIIECPHCKSKVATNNNTTSKKETTKETESELDTLCPIALCHSCMYAFCVQCKKTWRENQICTSIHLKKTNIEITSVLSKPPEKWTDDEKGTINEFITTMSLVKLSKGCPSCGVRIAKIDGCNKMTCPKCHSYFCWKCEQKISGYQHFSQTICKLFDDIDDIEREEVHMSSVVTLDTVMQQNKFKTINCPKCDNVNFKVSVANLISCWSCRFSFCFSCKQACYGKYHFTQYGCNEFEAIEDN